MSHRFNWKATGFGCGLPRNVSIWEDAAFSASSFDQVEEFGGCHLWVKIGLGRGFQGQHILSITFHKSNGVDGPLQLGQSYSYWCVTKWEPAGTPQKKPVSLLPWNGNCKPQNLRHTHILRPKETCPEARGKCRWRKICRRYT